MVLGRKIKLGLLKTKMGSNVIRFQDGKCRWYLVVRSEGAWWISTIKMMLPEFCSEIVYHHVYICVCVFTAWNKWNHIKSHEWCESGGVDICQTRVFHAKPGNKESKKENGGSSSPSKSGRRTERAKNWISSGNVFSIIYIETGATSII